MLENYFMRLILLAYDNRARVYINFFYYVSWI
jgi:hypothetical protein